MLSPSTVLPGCVLLAVALGVGWIFRRWFDAIPPRVMCLILALILSRFGPELFAGRVPLPLELVANTWPFAEPVEAGSGGNSVQSDLLFEVTPLRHLVSQELRAGKWPLWNQRFGTGMPLLANPQAQVFEPTALAAAHWGVPSGLGLTSSLRLLLAFVFVFALARRLGLGLAASTLAAVSYSLGGYLSLWMGWPLAAVAVWTPGALYGLLLVIRRGKGCDLVLAATVCAALFVSGHPETILYSTVGCALFAAILLAKAQDWRQGLRRLIGVGALGAGLASPALLPAIHYLPQTHRHELLVRRNLRLQQGDVPATEGLHRSEVVSTSLRQVVPLLAPRALGSDSTGTYRGPPLGDRPGSGFPGTEGLVLCLAGLATRPKRGWPELFFAGTAALALAVVAKPPGLPAALAQIPVLSSLPNQWGRVSLWFNLGIALAAAHSLERWLHAGPFSRRWGVAAFVSAVLGAMLGMLGSPAGLAGGTFLAVQLAVAVAAGLVLASSPSGRKASGLIGLALLELTLAFGSDFSRMPRGQGIPTSPLFTALRTRTANQPPFRIAALGDGLPPNLAALADLDDLRISDPAKPWLPHQYQRPLQRDPRSIADRFDRAGLADPLLRWLGVRFLFVPPGETLDPPWSTVLRSPEGSIYERADALPLVFLAREIRAAGPKTALSFDGLDADIDRLELRSHSADRWSMACTSDHPRWLASSMFDDGGWRVMVDGERVETVTVQKAFLGADISAGAHRIDLLYRPRAFVLGALLAALAMGGLAAVALRRP